MRTLLTGLTLALSLAAAGCDDNPPRSRDPAEDPDAALSLDRGLDGPPDLNPSLLDAEPDQTPADLGFDLAVDQGDAFLEPDRDPPEPEICDGQDQDGDGRIDEGVANACGGCGGIPPEGCQAWRVDLVQDAEHRLTPDRVVGLIGAALGFSEQPIDNARCEILRVPAAPVDAHLGQVNVDAPGADLNLGPVYDDRLGAHRYLNTPELGATTLHTSGDPVTVRAGGGQLVGPFRLDLTAPDRLDGLTEADLEPLAALAQGRQDTPHTLRWTPGADPAQRVQLFIGGSRPIFRTSVYRGTDSYQLDASLRDDGAYTLDPELFGGGLPESAFRVDLTRQQETRLPLGSHSITARIGHRLRLGRSGPVDRDDPRPFQITEPSPNIRRITPGEPVQIAWTPLPEGAGPLVVTLILQDNALPERRQVSCTVTDPTPGTLTLPPELTAFWPTGETDVRILALRWDLQRTPLPPPARGELIRSQTIQMDLLP